MKRSLKKIAAFGGGAIVVRISRDLTMQCQPRRNTQANTKICNPKYASRRTRLFAVVKKKTGNIYAVHRPGCIQQPNLQNIQERGTRWIVAFDGSKTLPSCAVITSSKPNKLGDR